MATVLLLAANPIDNYQLRLDEEIREIDQGIKHSRFGSQLKFESKKAVRLRDLLEYLETVRPDIVHFSGHGSTSSEMMLVDERGNGYPVSKETMQKILAILKGKTKCMVLNACYTETLANAITDNMECVVVGMSGEVDDKFAIEFAREFYKQLADGKNVSIAYKLAKAHVPDGVAKLTFSLDPRKLIFVNRWRTHVFSAILLIALLVVIITSLFFRRKPTPPVPPALPRNNPVSSQESITDTQKITSPLVITIGVAIATSGEKAYAIGLEQDKGIKIAKDYFSSEKYKILLRSEDVAEDKNKNEIQKAEQAFNRLVSSDVLAIIGPTLSAQALVVDHIANDNKIPVIAISNTHPRMRNLGSYIFRVSAGVEVFTPRVISYVEANKVVHNALIWYLDEPDSFTVRECQDGFTSNLSSRVNLLDGKNIPYSREVANSTSPERDTLVASVQFYPSKPDLIIICGLTNDGVQLIKNLRTGNNGVLPPYEGIIIGGNGLNTPSFLSLCAGQCKDVYLAQAYDYTSRSKLNEDFKKDYTIKSPQIDIPTQYAAQAFTGVQVLVETIKKIEAQNGAETFNQMPIEQKREAIRDFLLTSGYTFDTLLGSISLDKSGDVSGSNIVVIQVNENDEFEIRG